HAAGRATGEKRFDFTGEKDGLGGVLGCAPVRALIVVQRLYAEAGAGGEEALASLVPDEEGEHADKAFKTRFAPFFVGGENDFGVGLAVVGVVVYLLAQ